MFKNYFKVAWRSLLKQKLYSIINIGGLALGITCFLTIFIYVQHELSYDSFHEGAQRIYKVYQKQGGNTFMGTENFAVVPVGLSVALREEIPEVQNTTLVAQRKKLIGYKGHHFYEKGLFADEHFLEVFSFELLKGNGTTALKDANSILLTESFANKLFEGEEAIGKVLSIDNEYEVVVKGILKNLPQNSTLNFEYLLSFSSDTYFAEQLKELDWQNSSYALFMKTTHKQELTALNAKLSALANNFINDNENAGNPWEVSFYAKPLSPFHFYTDANFDIGTKGNNTYVTLFSYVGITILLLACINYINLAIARSVKRTHEVGLRKVVGAKYRQIIFQFLGESYLIAGIALCIALALTQLLLPLFGELIERYLTLDVFQKPKLLFSLFILLLCVGLLSGGYPAFYVAKSLPIQSLKGKAEKPKLFLQRGLVVLQYAAAIFLAISSIVIFRQFQFIQNKELGYATEQIINVQVNREFPTKIAKEQWKQFAGITQVTASLDLPSEVTSSTTVTNDSTSEERFNIYQTRTDTDYLSTYEIALVAGRMFNDEEKDGENEVCVLNETAVKMLGFTPESAVGKQVFLSGQYATIVGVAKDYHTHSFHLAIQPLALRPISWYVRFLSVKVTPNNLSETLAMLEESVRTYSPYPFEYNFFEDEFDRLYKAEIRFGKMFSLFTLLSLLIASVGLFGLAAFSATQRTKEIGVRKVLGASVQTITFIITKDFIPMVVIGFVVAAPTAWYAMNRWLEGFAYRISVEWWMLLIVGVLAVIISVLTVGSQSLRAAFTNPVESLRSE